MPRRLLLFLLGGLFLVGDLAPSQAQQWRPERTYFVQSHLGFSLYSGDNDGNPQSDWGTYLRGAGWLFGVEGGYQINPTFAIGAALSVGNFPRIAPTGQTRTSRQMVLFFGQAQFLQTRAAPYIKLGWHILRGHLYKPDGSTPTKWGLGPTVGFGVNYIVTDQLSAAVEVHQNFVFPDAAADGADPQGIGDKSSFDIIGFVGLVGRYTFKKACDPARIIEVDGPRIIETDQVGTFRAAVDEGGSRTSYRWDLGDGTAAEGMMIDHSFAQAGTYSLIFFSEGCDGVSSKTITVEVINRVVAPQIQALTVSNSNPVAGDAVQFNAQTVGAPLSYTWDFGDGRTSNEAQPLHAYTQAGLYTVVLRLSNSAGTVEDTLPVQVMAPVQPCVALTNLAPVYFAPNTFALSNEALAILRDNLERLRNCSHLRLRVVTYADQSESAGLRLSQSRARAIENFYVINGIAISRIVSEGRGVASETCPARQGGGCPAHRRGETQIIR